jgi:hypothetical protein
MLSLWFSCPFGFGQDNRRDRITKETGKPKGQENQRDRITKETG